MGVERVPWLAWLVLVCCLVGQVRAVLECETDNPDFTIEGQGETLVCPYESPELYGAFPLNYLVSQGVESFRPTSTTVEAQQVMLSGIFPQALLHTLWTGEEYAPDSMADVVSSCIIWTLIFTLIALYICGVHYPRDCAMRRVLIAGFCKLDRSQETIVNASKVMLKATFTSQENRDSDDDAHYVETETRGTTLGGLSSGLLYIIGGGALFWTIYVCTHSSWDAPLRLPEDLSTDFTSGQPPYLRQRDVQASSYNSLDTEVGTYLRTNMSNRDHLYVVEVLSGSDWGVTPYPYSEDFLAMSFEDKISAEEVFYYVPSLEGLDQADMPTSMWDVWMAESLDISTEGCYMAGGQACSDVLYLDSDNWYDKPLLSYGCYQDQDDIYHHV
ncbi:hypothetical protein KIPB_010845, partial [Kipferlia bialata]|eukprot:g10845.t1